MSRINLRMPEQLRARIEAAAARRALGQRVAGPRGGRGARIGRSAGRREGRAPQGAQRYRGWAR